MKERKQGLEREKWNFRESVKKGRQKRRNRIDGKEAEEERKRRKVGENERKLRREKVGRRRKRSGLVRGKIERSSKDLSPLSLFPSIAFRSFLSYFERNFLSQGWTQSLEIAFTASKTFCLGKKVSLSLFSKLWPFISPSSLLHFSLSFSPFWTTSHTYKFKLISTNVFRAFLWLTKCCPFFPSECEENDCKELRDLFETLFFPFIPLSFISFLHPFLLLFDAFDNCFLLNEGKNEADPSTILDVFIRYALSDSPDNSWLPSIPCDWLALPFRLSFLSRFSLLLHSLSHVFSLSQSLSLGQLWFQEFNSEKFQLHLNQHDLGCLGEF